MCGPGTDCGIVFPLKKITRDHSARNCRRREVGPEDSALAALPLQVTFRHTASILWPPLSALLFIITPVSVLPVHTLLPTADTPHSCTCSLQTPELLPRALFQGPEAAHEGPWLHWGDRQAKADCHMRRDDEQQVKVGQGFQEWRWPGCWLMAGWASGNSPSDKASEKSE